MYSPARIAKAAYWMLAGNSAQKRRVRQECARAAASLFGDYPITDDFKLWREDREFLDTFSQLSPNNPYSQERKYLLREFVKFSRKLPGCMAECGCYEGASAYFMASANLSTPLHLFDSFEGLSRPTQADAPLAKDRMPWRAGDMSSPIEKLLSTLSELQNVYIHKGWIPEQFPKVADMSFSIVHIDVDLYEPTRDSLEFFYPRLNPNGVVIMDDYGSTLCPGARKAAEEFFAPRPEYILHFPTGQGVVIKQ